MSRLNSSSSCWWLHTDRERRRRFGGTLSNSLCVCKGLWEQPDAPQLSAKACGKRTIAKHAAL